MPSYTVYIVQPGESLWDIARRFDTEVNALARMNDIRDPSRLSAGQELRVPRPPMGGRPPRPPRPLRGDVYVVQPGDTLGDIAARYGTTVAVLLRLNGLQNSELIYPGQELRVPAVPPAEGRFYEVQPGDTLWSIAAENGTTWEELARLNNIGTPNLIFPGERLRLR